MFSQALLISRGWLMNKTMEEWKGRTGSGRRARRKRKPPCGWQWILLPKTSPSPPNKKALYISLCKPYHALGWVGVSHRNAMQCVCILRFPWSKRNTLNPSTKPLIFNRPDWQPQVLQLNWNQVAPLIHKGIRRISRKHATELTLASTRTIHQTLFPVFFWEFYWSEVIFL